MNMWRWPIASAAASIVGLTAGLILDGWGDVLGWAGLGLPVAQCAWYWLLRPGPATPP